MTSIRRAARASAAVALLLAATTLVSPARAAHLSCGDVVTADVTLDGDIGPCPGDGLVVGASGTSSDPITIDLNGHRIFGTSGLDDTPGVGIRVAGQSYIEITSSVTGGQVDHFDAGVLIDGTGAAATDNVVENLIVRDNFPERLLGGDFGDGITVFGGGADNTTIEDNTVVNNGPFSGISTFGGTSADEITGTLITGNTVLDNRSQSSQTGGIRLENWSSNSTVSDNTVRGSSLDGIALFADNQNITVENNVVVDNGANGNPTHRPGDGIHLFARNSSHTIQGNTVNENARSGIVLDGPVSTFTGAVNNTVTGNTALDNDTNPLILIEEPPLRVEVNARVSATAGGVGVELPPPSGASDLVDNNTMPPCDNNTWTNNTFGTRNQTCIS